MKVITRSTVRKSIVPMLMAFVSFCANAEPMEPYLTKEAALKLIDEVQTAKSSPELVDDLLDIAQYFLAQNDRKAEEYLNRAIAMSKTLQYPEGTVKAFCHKATLLHKILKDRASAHTMWESAVSVAKTHKLREMEAFAYYTKGEWDGIEDHEIAITYYSKARELYKASGNKVNEAFVLKSIANTHLYQNKLSQSLKELLEALEIYKSAGFSKLHYTYDLIGVLYKAMGNYQESLKYAFLSIKSAEQTRDTMDIELFYFRVGLVFVELNQPSEAIQYFTKVLDITQHKEGRFNYVQGAASWISKILVDTGKPAEALEFFTNVLSGTNLKKGNIDYGLAQRTFGDIQFALNNYPKAEEHYLNMLEVDQTNSFGDNFNLASYLKLGNFYIAQGKFAKAREYITRALQQNSFKTKSDIANLHLQQFKVDSAFANYVSAIGHFQMFKSLNDTMFNEQSNRQIASMNIQYDTERKLQQIETLTAKNKEQSVNLEKRIFERNVFTIGAIMLLLLLLLSANRYLIKQRANKKLRAQQEIINDNILTLNCLLKEKESLLKSKDQLIHDREWLIKEVHHRVKNNLQMISTLLYSQATYLKDGIALAVVKNSQQRIDAISLLHQKLYQSDNLQLVNMKNYVHELVDYLKESYDTIDKIEFDLEIDSFELEIAKATPLGLILNEAITNSMKYAFGQNKKKLITILLERQEDQTILLVIRDNGRGMPMDFDPFQSDTLGINLMKGLSEQIGAEFTIRNENGTIILLTFPVSEKFILGQVI